MFRRKFCAMLAGVPLFGRFMPGAAVVTLSGLPVEPVSRCAGASLTRMLLVAGDAEEPEPAVDRAIGYHEALDVVRATLKANHAFREGLGYVIADKVQEAGLPEIIGYRAALRIARHMMAMLLGTKVSGTERADL